MILYGHMTDHYIADYNKGHWGVIDRQTAEVVADGLSYEEAVKYIDTKENERKNEKGTRIE